MLVSYSSSLEKSKDRAPSGSPEYSLPFGDFPGVMQSNNTRSDNSSSLPIATNSEDKRQGKAQEEKRHKMKIDLGKAIRATQSATKQKLVRKGRNGKKGFVN